MIITQRTHQKTKRLDLQPFSARFLSITNKWIHALNAQYTAQGL